MVVPRRLSKLTGEPAGPPLSRENQESGTPTLLSEVEGNTRGGTLAGSRSSH